MSEGIIIKAYEAVLDAERWRGVLDEVVATTGACGSALLVHEYACTDSRYNVSAVSSRYVNFLSSPDGELYLRELNAHEQEELRAVAALPPGELFVDTDMGTTVAELKQRPDVALLAKHTGANRRTGFRLNNNNAWFDLITVGFDNRYDSVSGQLLATVEGTWPHLAKALELTRTFSMLRARYNAVLTVLDKLAIGILIVLPSGEVLIANACANEILDCADGLMRDSFGHLKCANPDQAAALRDAVMKAGATAGGKGATSEKLMLVSRKSGSQALLLDIAPISESGVELDHTLQGCVIVVTDPDNPPDIDMQRFARLNGLTPAETGVCELVVAGDTVPIIAEKRSVSQNTVRNQIKAVLQKTGCTSRVQLLREAAKAMPPIV